MSHLTNTDCATLAVLGVDPDSAHTALCVLLSDGTATLVGGGSRADGRPLCAVKGARDVLAALGPARVAAVFVETQAANSQWSKACDGVRRARYMWEAACELASVCVYCVDPSAWQRHWVGAKARQDRTSRESARGIENNSHPLRDAAATQSDRRAPLVGVKCANDDQRSALGIAAFGATQLGWAMPWD